MQCTRVHFMHRQEYVSFPREFPHQVEEHVNFKLDLPTRTYTSPALRHYIPCVLDARAIIPLQMYDFSPVRCASMSVRAREIEHA